MNEKKILKNKVYLYLTEFFAGMSVMAVELGASRLLAPYFSSSQIVWTIIIGTIMIAMALGNVYGGRSADKNPDPDKLYGRIIIAAIWIGLIPVAGKYIIIGISGVLIFSVNSNFLIIAGFAACMIIFVFPLFLLGTVTPSLVKFTVDNLDDNGRLVGNLNAFNTIGSIIGTFVPTFVTIPAVGTSITFLVFAGILLVLAIIYFAVNKTNPLKMKKVFGGIIIFIISCIFGHKSNFAFWEDNLKYEGESIYNYLQVYENEKEVRLSTNVLFGVQSVFVKDEGLSGSYYDYALLAPFMMEKGTKEKLDILILGNGSGTYATQLKRYFKKADITGIEIDEKITDLAEDYFYMPKSIDVLTYDGRAYLNAVKERYDIILVDAYQDITVPFQMASKEFFTLVKNHLNKDGVMLINMNMRSDKPGNINDYLSDTISDVFGTVYTVDVEGYTNRELFASDNPDIIKNLEYKSLEEDSDELKDLAFLNKINLKKYEAGEYIMTDDKAPVELLSMNLIDDLIKEEVSEYKKIYDKEGLKGLLNNL